MEQTGVVGGGGGEEGVGGGGGQYILTQVYIIICIFMRVSVHAQVCVYRARVIGYSSYADVGVCAVQCVLQSV